MCSINQKGLQYLTSKDELMKVLAWMLQGTQYPLTIVLYLYNLTSCRWNGFNQQATLFEVSNVGTSMHGVVMHGDSDSVQLDKVYIA